MNRTALPFTELQHSLDLIGAELRIMNQRLEALEKQANDHESRLRSATEGVTQLKVWAGLAAGGSGILTLVTLGRMLLTGSQ